MERNMSLGADGIDWADSAFSSSEFQDSMLAESPWGNSALNDFTNLADYSDSPALRTPSKSGADAAASTAAATQQSLSLPQDSSISAESSSADSGSESSSRRKRKTTSESPLSNAAPGHVATIKEEPMMNVDDYAAPSNFPQAFSQPMPRLAVDQAMSDNNGLFDFNSAASSPNLPRDFNQQLSLDANNTLITTTAANHFSQESPVRTINPGMFTLGGSGDQSPSTTTNSAIFNAASPNAFFSTPSSDSNEPFHANQNWANSITANPAWPADFTSQFASPGGLNFTPSPVANGGTPSLATRGNPSMLGRSILHVAPISAKSRVETQINVVMTLEKPPASVEHLHLPLHTIAKSKLLAKEDYDASKVLELHTMLVCSSAMHVPNLKEKALQRAASQNNEEIQRRAEQEREYGDDEKNNMKNVEEADKPSNGGEVRICNNCIQRERKRAGRKKLKKEEEQQHWERYETERVVVFNSSEYLPFKPYEQRDQTQKDGGLAADDAYEPPPGALSVSAAMRIACYCRHQSEKEGFQVIFTMKDQQGNVVAQEMSDSILITDDHKTHPSTLPHLSNDVYFQQGQMSANGLPSSYSMMDLASHGQPFTSSRSAGNLQALAYGQQLQFNPHSHIHQVPNTLNTGYASQATSATMTPTNLSRPGSPNSAGQTGPNKKRKSASFHKRLPSGLQMTPRVDTTPGQPQSATLSSGLSPGLPSGISASSFSPTRGAFGGQSDQSYMTIPNNSGPAQYYESGPPTPAGETTQFQFSQPHQLDISRAQSAAYFSHPSSAVPSRSNSPVLQHSRPALSAFPRQPIQTPTNQMTRPASMFAGSSATRALSSENNPAAPPSITKITPVEGPVAGGTEVSIYGYNFTNQTQVMFGDSVAVTRTLYGSKSILAVSPPGRRGPVRVRLVTEMGPLAYPSTQSNNHVFTYTDTTPQMMKMALQFLSQQQTGDPNRWQQYASEVANQFMQTSISPAGIHGHNYSGGDVFAGEPADTEEVVLKVLDLVDVSESPRQPCYDLCSERGQTMLGLASASGMHQVVAALLARGANPDTRDDGGYTPLIHAAFHERPKTFQLLLIKGADPTIRTLAGDAAIDLVPEKSREDFLHILHNTQRTRSARPSFHRYGSNGSSRVSWDISSASFYDSEFTSSEHVLSTPASRRPSVPLSLPPTPEETPESIQPTSPAAMIAWRDALAAQIHQFQQTVQSSMSSIQLPALPPLADCQDNAMVRRLSSFVSSRCPAVGAAAPRHTPRAAAAEHLPSHPPTNSSRLWDKFSALAPASVPPPAYSELFPERLEGTLLSQQLKKTAVQTAVVDAVADRKCAVLFEEQQEEEAAAQISPSGLGIPDDCASQSALSGRTRRPQLFWLLRRLWVWVALLAILMSVMLSMMTTVTTMSMRACFDDLFSRFSAVGCGVLHEMGMNEAQVPIY